MNLLLNTKLSINGLLTLKRSCHRVCSSYQNKVIKMQNSLMALIHWLMRRKMVKNKFQEKEGERKQRFRLCILEMSTYGPPAEYATKESAQASLGGAEGKWALLWSLTVFLEIRKSARACPILQWWENFGIMSLRDWIHNTSTELVQHVTMKQ